MASPKNIRLLPLLMVLTILGIAGFQYYWLSKAYEREKWNLGMRSNFLFRETVFGLQSVRLKLDRIGADSATRLFIQRGAGESRRPGEPRGQRMTGPDPKVINMVDVLMSRAKDSGKTIIINGTDTLPVQGQMGRRSNRLMQFLFDVDSIQDSIKVREIETEYAKRLEKENLDVDFAVSRVPTPEKDERMSNTITLGFARPISYHLELGDTSWFLLKRIGVPILFSVFLLAFTVLSFLLLYRNLLRQRRLGDIKNEFISNITHELKTPIATVSVAIEALRNYSASIKPEQQKEYLDISANELQRLSLLVDKVLKLSMFEKREIELKYEPLDMRSLVNEVTSSMRLQFEKHKAEVKISAEGDTALEGDRLHLVSVIFNLVDNALKYSKGIPKIGIDIRGTGSDVQLTVSDSGIGIPTEYQDRIFEKFFRVPTGNLHDAKGYGLGLSYVAHVVRQHRGTITVESAPGQGSRFLISLPKA